MGHHVIRTENFATDAADFILDEAHKALGERSEFRIALSGGNTPVPIYTRLAVIGHDLPWELASPRMIDRVTSEWPGKPFSGLQLFLKINPASAR
jgi:6-phosphogluconolactonase/glucosamine-6-phosphate isomerase/deaminase